MLVRFGLNLLKIFNLNLGIIETKMVKEQGVKMRKKYWENSFFHPFHFINER